jgi:Zn-dependent protease
VRRRANPAKPVFSRIFRNSAWLSGAAFGIAALPLLQSGEEPHLLTLVFTLTFLIISLGIHEAAHATVADWCGDPTAKDLGRITLNPIPHIDPFMTVILPAVLYLGTGGRMLFGGAKPVPVSYHRLRHPLRDMMLVALAGPASNFLLAVFFVLAWKFAVYIGHLQPAHYDRYGDLVGGQLLPQVLSETVRLNLLLAAFNMLPIPPLDGSRVMTWLLPAPLRAGYVALERFGILLVMGLLYLVPQVQFMVLTGVEEMQQLIDMFTGGAW